MQKILITLSEAEFECVEKEAKKIGMLPSTYAKYKVLDGILPKASYTLSQLTGMMHSKLNSLKKDETFIVSTLVPPDVWRELTTSDKRSLSSNLSNYVKMNTDTFLKTNDRMPDKTIIYKKIKD